MQDGSLSGNILSIQMLYHELEAIKNRLNNVSISVEPLVSLDTSNTMPTENNRKYITIEAPATGIYIFTSMDANIGYIAIQNASKGLTIHSFTDGNQWHTVSIFAEKGDTLVMMCDNAIQKLFSGYCEVKIVI